MSGKKNAQGEGESIGVKKEKKSRRALKAGKAGVDNTVFKKSISCPYR